MSVPSTRSQPAGTEKKVSAPVADQQTKMMQPSDVPAYLEAKRFAGAHPGQSPDWDDPRAGLDLDVAMRSRTARRIAYESRNPPSIVRHLAQAFVGKNSTYTESTQYTVDEHGATRLIDAAMFSNSSGFLHSVHGGPDKTETDEKKVGETVDSSQDTPYPDDLKPSSSFLSYRPRGLRSTRLSMREDGTQREWLQR